jgi:hypothetical protein
MAFPAGKIASGLIDGEIVFGTRELNRGDEPEGTDLCLFERGLAGEDLSLSNINGTTSLWVSLLNQITLHF